MTAPLELQVKQTAKGVAPEQVPLIRAPETRINEYVAPGHPLRTMPYAVALLSGSIPDRGYV